MRPITPTQGRHPQWETLYGPDNWARLPWYTDDLDAMVTRYLDEHSIHRGRCLDLGCGDGTQSARLAMRGLDVVGIDIAPGAINAAARFGLTNATFICADALDFDATEPFDIVLDRGFLHVLPIEVRPRYAALLRRVTKPGSLVLLSCFSSSEPDPGFGPERLSTLGVAQVVSPDFVIEDHALYRWIGPLAARPLTHFFALRRTEP